MSVPSLAKRFIRRQVVWFSVKNRTKKARAINAWLDEHRCQTLLFVGSLGENSAEPNADIVERAVTTGRTLKMTINVEDQVTSNPFMVADGRDMPFEDDYVDFSLANAVIEHVGNEDDQRRLVAEQTRVSRCWVITTPNRWFPIESHTSVAFLHWSPAWRRGRTEFTRLLSLGEFKALLPEGAIVTGQWWSPTFTAFYCRPAPEHLDGQ